MNYLHNSAYFSIIVQLITGLIELHGIFIPVKQSDTILRDILTMEVTVQFIELSFYIYMVYRIVSGQLSKYITSHRYADWMLTTPVMLTSFVIFFKYLKNPEKNIRLVDSVKEEKDTIIKIVIANAMMLLLGFLAERSIINRYVGVTVGFLPFAYVFKMLYANYVKDNDSIAYIIYYLSFLVWGLYGVAAVLPFKQKNTMYNILDLFAKNVYGLFLYLFIREKYV